MFGALLLLVAFGLIALLVAFSRWLAHRYWAAAGNVVVGFALLWLAQTLWPPAMHLRTYEPLPGRAATIAQVHCERSGQRTYRVTLTRLPAGRMQVLEMAGDQWRIEARTLAWRGRAAQVGLPASFRFERLSSRYLSTEPRRPADASRDPSPSYALGDPDEPGEDIWSQARTGQAWSVHVDPRRVYGPWRPLADEARYDVWLVGSPGSADVRLEVRPANEAASRAMR